MALRRAVLLSGDDPVSSDLWSLSEAALEGSGLALASLIQFYLSQVGLTLRSSNLVLVGVLLDS